MRSMGHDGRRGSRGLEGEGGTGVGFSACSGEWTKGNDKWRVTGQWSVQQWRGPTSIARILKGRGGWRVMKRSMSVGCWVARELLLFVWYGNRVGCACIGLEGLLLLGRRPLRIQVAVSRSKCSRRLPFTSGPEMLVGRIRGESQISCLFPK